MVIFIVNLYFIGSSDNEMPVSCSSSNIEGQMSNGDDDDEVTICKIKMEPPDLEYCTVCL